MSQRPSDGEQGPARAALRADGLYYLLGATAPCTVPAVGIFAILETHTLRPDGTEALREHRWLCRARSEQALGPLQASPVHAHGLCPATLQTPRMSFAQQSPGFLKRQILEISPRTVVWWDFNNLV